MLPIVVVAYVSFIYYRERDVLRSTPYSTFWPRVFSPCIDYAILWPFIGLLPAVLIYLSEFTDYDLYLLSFITALVFPCYTILMQGIWGATLGKMGCKIDVCAFSTRGHISFKHAILRDCIPLFAIAGLFVWNGWLDGSKNYLESMAYKIGPSFYLAWIIMDVLTLFFNEKRRSIPDFVAGTVIMRHR